MSELLDAMIKKRQAGAFAYEQYLTHMMDLARQVTNPANSTSYPSSMSTGAKRALYDNLGNNESLALDAEIEQARKDGWHGNRIKEREIQHAIYKPIQRERRDDTHVLTIITARRRQRTCPFWRTCIAGIHIAMRAGFINHDHPLAW